MKVKHRKQKEKDKKVNINYEKHGKNIGLECKI